MEKANKVTKSYFHEPSIFKFLNITLGELVDKAADEHGNDVGFVFCEQNVRKTFSEFRKDVNKLAMGFIHLGLEKGDKLAIWSTNCYEWIVSQFAAHKIGLLVVCVNIAFRGPELEPLLRKMQCKAIVIAESFKGQNFYDTLCEIIPEISKCKAGNIQSQRLKHLRHVIQISDKSYSGTHSFKELISNNRNKNNEMLKDRMKAVEMDDACIVMLTSGTTGTPKAAALSHFHLINQGNLVVKRLGYEKEKPIICVQLPLFHIFATLAGEMITLMTFGTSVFPSGHYSTISSLKCIQEERCTVVGGTPTMFADMLNHLNKDKYNVTSIKDAIIGAAPIPNTLEKSLREKLGVNIFRAYGSTEVAGALTLGDENKLPGAGKILEHSEVKIVGRNGEVVPINTKGEILCRSPTVFLGYWEDKEKTEKVLDVARWYNTGDIGVMDEYGCLTVTGRTKDLIIRGGQNIYPEEIEDFLQSHPDISEIYIVGVPDSRLGEEVCACIKLKHDKEINVENIKEFCKGKISNFKIPRYVLLFEDFPRTETGKVQKTLLQKACIEKLKLSSKK